MNFLSLEYIELHILKNRKKIPNQVVHMLALESYFHSWISVHVMPLSHFEPDLAPPLCYGRTLSLVSAAFGANVCVS